MLELIGRVGVFIRFLAAAGLQVAPVVSIKSTRSQHLFLV